MSRGPDERGEIRGQPDDPAPALGGAPPGYDLRHYRPADEDVAIALWLRTWQATYPQIDFAARLDWWRDRWRDELAADAEIVVLEREGNDRYAMAGFVTVDPRTLYLDQIVVAPELWGSGAGAALIAEAKRLSPAGLDLDVNIDNTRAIRFYEKHGFFIGGAGVNPISGKPVHRMTWRPQSKNVTNKNSVET
jgi:putative acetyltransferase